MSNVKELTRDNLGQFVYYIPFKGADLNQWQKGKIKSFNNEDKRAFVVYHCDENWDEYLDYTAAGTRYEDLYLPAGIGLRYGQDGL